MADSDPPPYPDLAPCQVYLAVPPETAPASLLELIEAAGAACVLIRRGGLDAAALRARVQALCPPAQACEVAVLLEDDAALAAELGCDGVHLGDPAGYEAARAALGPDAIVGVACGGSRHDAMVAGESGADYVAFGTLEPARAAESDLIAWWQALMTLPCVALGAGTPEEAGTLARAGADFVALAPWAWHGPDGPVGLRAVAAALAAPAG